MPWGEDEYGLLKELVEIQGDIAKSLEIISDRLERINGRLKFL